MGSSNNEVASRLVYLKFLFLAITYGLYGSLYCSIPFIFYRPELDCLDSQGETFECTLEQACSNPYGYAERNSDYPQIYSLVSYLNLHCERRIIESWILTFSQVGKIFSYIALMIFPLSTELKEKLVYGTSFASGLLLCSLFWAENAWAFAAVLCLWNLLFSIFYGVLYSYIGEAFPKNLSHFGTAFVNAAMPIIMVIYIALNYFFCSWQNSLIHFAGFPLLLISICSIVLSKYMNKTIPNNSKFEDPSVQNNLETELISIQCSQTELQFENHLELCPLQNEKTNDSIKSFSVKEQLSNNWMELKSNKRIRINSAVWALCWSCNGICFYGCYISLSSLKGDLFANNMTSTLLEVLSSLLAVGLVKQGHLQATTEITYFLIGVCFTACSLINSSSIIIGLLPIIVAKISYEMMWTVMSHYQKFLIPPHLLQFHFSVANTIAMICCNTLPFYKYYMESLGLSPFFGYGLVCLVSFYFSRKLEDIQADSTDKNKISMRNQEKQEL